MINSPDYEIICKEWSEWKRAHLTDSNKWLLAIKFQLLKDELDDLSNDIQLAAIDNDVGKVLELTERFERMFKQFRDSLIVEILKNE